MLIIQRVYDLDRHRGGRRFLVERLWPRGVKKETLQLDGWLKDVAPSTELREWFGHDPVKWQEFRRRYFEELDSEPDAWKPIARAARQGDVTLLYSAHDSEHNSAVVLKEYLERHVRSRKPVAA